MVIPIPVYKGTENERFNPFNHFVSELGEVAVSEYSTFFNLGLILGGFILIIFMFGLRNYVKTKSGRLASMFGLLAAISTSFIGIFPMDNFFFHQAVAFFMVSFTLLSTGFFSYYIWSFKPVSMPNWLLYPGLISWISFGTFLALFLASPQMLFNNPVHNRPDFWIYTIVEWIAFLSVIIWITLISLMIRKVKKD